MAISLCDFRLLRSSRRFTPPQNKRETPLYYIIFHSLLQLSLRCIQGYQNDVIRASVFILSFLFRFHFGSWWWLGIFLFSISESAFIDVILHKNNVLKPFQYIIYILYYQQPHPHHIWRLKMTFWRGLKKIIYKIHASPPFTFGFSYLQFFGFCFSIFCGWNIKKKNRPLPPPLASQ